MSKAVSVWWAIAFMLVGCAPAGSQDNNEASTDPVETGDVSGAVAGERAPFKLPKGFNDYWYQGLAEVNRYKLTQARYGEIHEGNAVLIFVTEDFLVDEQVKLESPVGNRKATSVLKMNAVKKFLTGLYPYSMMTSVFTPVDLANYSHSLKATTSSQEWCGQTYTQVNLQGEEYRVRQYSYFEKEGDEDYAVPAALLEDEIWTHIRLAPKLLPTGTVKLLPGTMTARLRHTKHQLVNAVAKIEEIAADEDGNARMRYTLTYEDDRTLAIDFHRDFPHMITGWTETYNDFGNVLTTKAELTNSIMTDYWKKHSNADSVWRDKLGLPK